MFRSFGLLPSDVIQHSFPLRLAPPTKVEIIINEIKSKTINYVSKGIPAEDKFVENTFFYGNHSLKRLTLMKNFSVTKNCNGCGICASICPAHNIEIKDGKAVHGDECASCYACLHWCPKNATLVRVPGLKHRPQYRHPEITVKDMERND